MAAAILVWIGGTTDHENDIATATNWSSRTDGETARVPVAGDTVYFNSEATTDCNESLDELAAVALAALRIDQSFTYELGAAGEYFQCLCADVRIGQYEGTTVPSGSSLVNLDLGTTATDIIVYNTGTPSGSGSAVNILAVNASNTISIQKGRVGIATGPGEVSTFDTIQISSSNNGAVLVVGEGVTVTTIDKTGGIIYCLCGATTINNSGTAYIRGESAITTINHADNTMYLETSGTVTNLNINGGKVDTSGSGIARIITNVTIESGASYIRDNSVITETNGIKTGAGVRTVTVK